MHIHGVIIYVREMAPQVAFYRDVLDLIVAYPEHGPYDGLDWVMFQTGMCSLALHSGGVDAEVLGPKIVFKVDNIEEAVRELLSRNVQIGSIRQVAPNIRVADFRDPEGNCLAIEQVD